MAHATIHQLNSIKVGHGAPAFLNVSEDYGHVQVWTSTYGSPTYLLNYRKNHVSRFIQFEDEEYAKEYFESNKAILWGDEYPEIIKLGADNV